MRALSSLMAIAALILTPALLIAAVPLGTAFTYQGQLKNGGSLINATADLQFSLWDATTAGTQIGSTQTLSNVAVANGLFTVQLDFGAAAFAGDRRWLEVAVRSPAGSGSFTTLSPRQNVTPTPYALNVRAPLNLTSDQPGGQVLTVVNSNTGASALGLSSETKSPSGLGMFGYASSTTGVNYGVYGRTESPDGNAVFGWAKATTGSGVGVYGYANGPTASAVYGFAVDGSGSNYGVFGQSLSSAGIGVYGTSNNVGVKGETSNSNAAAIWGNNTGGGTGVSGYGGNYGVFGQGGTYGVWGYSNNIGVYGSGGNYAGYFNGWLYVSGYTNVASLNVGSNATVNGSLNANSFTNLYGYTGIYNGSTLYVTGNTGLGISAPVYQLQLSQNSAAKPTSNTWTISSDARLKKNIKPIQHALTDLLSLRGVTYQWKDPKSQGDMNGTYTGMIAQDVEKVYPEWVREDANGYKTLTIIGFEGIVVEALRELRAEQDAQLAERDARVDDLSKRLNQKECGIDALRTELAELKSVVGQMRSSMKECISERQDRSQEAFASASRAPRR